ncbi:hypothetical protein BKA83DRAFT_326037 [Pisolithus microcarpus]|nr:hypothetical protein BKA83DRAFT_326037 [Pisolithus microcarpus]
MSQGNVLPVKQFSKLRSDSHTTARRLIYTFKVWPRHHMNVLALVLSLLLSQVFIYLRIREEMGPVGAHHDFHVEPPHWHSTQSIPSCPL